MPAALLLTLPLTGRLPGYKDHPVVVRPVHRSSQLSAEQLLLQQEVEESVLSGTTSARADWSKMAMIYLGQDRLYTYNMWSGDYSAWQYGACMARLSWEARLALPAHALPCLRRAQEPLKVRRLLVAAAQHRPL